MAKRRFPSLVLGALVVLATAGAIPAFAQSNGNGFISVQSTNDYSTTVSKLQQAIRDNGLMILGKVDQKAIMSMAGLNMEGGESFLVGNPRVGKSFFSMNPAVVAVIPGRISVWAQSGTTYVGYFQPSALMGMISSDLSTPAGMLDAKYQQIVQSATQ